MVRQNDLRQRPNVSCSRADGGGSMVRTARVPGAKGPFRGKTPVRGQSGSGRDLFRARGRSAARGSPRSDCLVVGGGKDPLVKGAKKKKETSACLGESIREDQKKKRIRASKKKRLVPSATASNAEDPTTGPPRSRNKNGAIPSRTAEPPFPLSGLLPPSPSG